MTAYYVNGSTGNDGGGSPTHDGTTPAKAWATVGYAVTHVSAGDTIWVAPGVYRISSTIAPSSMGSMTYLYADTDGSHNGVTGGEVRITNFATNDTTAASAATILTFGSKNFWTVKGFTLVSGSVNLCVSVTGTSHDITIQDCTIYGTTTGGGIQVTSLTWSTVPNVIIERCRIATVSGTIIAIGCPANGSGVDYSLNITIRNCVLLGPAANGIAISGTSNTAKSGGITIANCLVQSAGNAIKTTTVSGTSTTYPVTVYNSLVIGVTGIAASTLGQVVENYNIVVAGTALSNVTQGANTKIDGSIDWHTSLGHELKFGATTRPFGEPPAGSPLLTWGGTSVPSDDINGITRPASGASQTGSQQALGPFERANSGTHETTIVPAGTTDSVKIAGPGVHDFTMAVASGHATTVSVQFYVDASYSGTLPKLAVTNGGECGVADASVTGVGAASSWHTMTLGSFTPTANGIVTLRLTSNSTASAGNAYFGNWVVT